MTIVPTNREAELLPYTSKKTTLLQEIEERNIDLKDLDEEMKGHNSKFSKVEIKATTDAAKLLVETSEKRDKRRAKEEETLTRKQLSERLSMLADLPLGAAAIDKAAA